MLAETAASIAHDHGLKLTVLEREDCEALGMGAYLGVAQASDLPLSSFTLCIARKARLNANWPSSAKG